MQHQFTGGFVIGILFFGLILWIRAIYLNGLKNKEIKNGYQGITEGKERKGGVNKPPTKEQWERHLKSPPPKGQGGKAFKY